MGEGEGEGGGGGKGERERVEEVLTLNNGKYKCMFTNGHDTNILSALCQQFPADTGGLAEQ